MAEPPSAPSRDDESAIDETADERTRRKRREAQQQRRARAAAEAGPPAMLPCTPVQTPSPAIATPAASDPASRVWVYTAAQVERRNELRRERRAQAAAQRPPPTAATPGPRVRTAVQAARRNELEREHRAHATARRMETKEIDLLVASHDSSGSSAIADAMRFAHGRDDDRRVPPPRHVTSPPHVTSHPPYSFNLCLCGAVLCAV